MCVCVHAAGHVRMVGTLFDVYLHADGTCWLGGVCCRAGVMSLCVVCGRGRGCAFLEFSTLCEPAIANVSERQKLMQEEALSDRMKNQRG